MTKLLKEPLLHFLFIGLVMFITYDLLNDDYSEDEKAILVTQAQTELLFFQWAARGGRPPGEKEKIGLVNQFIRQEILYREAISLGLNQNDAVIRRRLAQKMEYLFDDLSPVPEPTDEELKAYINDKPARFIQARTLSFAHVYFNTDKGSEPAKIRAAALLAKLATDETLATDSGDRLLLPKHYSEVTEREVRNVLGEEFARDIFELPPDSWTGPVKSGYGLHLVKVTGITPDTMPPFAEMREEASREWQYEKGKALQDTFMKALRQKYHVTVEDDIQFGELETSQ
jgi:hypothetical protein